MYQTIANIFNNDSILEELHNQSIFLTGGTGFIGSSFLEVIKWANDILKLNIQVTILTRNAQNLQVHHPNFQILEGELKTFTFPNKKYAFIIHAAADARTTKPLSVLETTVNGTKHILDFAIHCQAKKFLFLSSGAIYGDHNQPITETSPANIDLTSKDAIYAEGKRIGEWLCSFYSDEHHLHTTIARLFSFIGPYLPLNREFAVGNFLKNALKREPIIIKSDGLATRSYLFSIDLVRYLLYILLRGRKKEAYNVGGNTPVTIKEIANCTANLYKSKVIILNKNISRKRCFYIPQMQKTYAEFNISPRLSLEDMLKETYIWQQKHCTNG